MPIDPNISLQVGNNVRPLDPLAAYGQVLTLKNAMDAQRLNSLQFEKAQQEAADQQAVRGAYVVTPDGQIDEQATMRNLVQRGQGPAAMDFRQKSAVNRATLSKEDREAEKARLDAIDKTNKIIGQELAALGDEPTYASAMDAGLRLVRDHGLKFDLNEIPQDPVKLRAFVRDRAWRAMEVEKQIAERRTALEPKTELGKLIRDRALYQGGQLTGNGAADRPLVGGVTDEPGGGLRLPGVTGTPLPDPFGARIAAEQYGPADNAFAYDQQGNVVGRENVQAFLKDKAAAGAQRSQIIMPEVEKSARIAGNKDFIENEYRPTLQADDSARKINNAADALERINFKSGALAPTKAAAANVLTAFGVASADIEKYAGDAQKFNTFVMERNWDLLNAAKGPQTEGDATRAQQTFLRLENTPDANKFIADYVRAANQRVRAKAKFYRDNYAKAQDAGDLSQLERQWASSPEAEKSIWDDPRMKKWAAKNGGSGVLTYDPATGTFK